MRSVQHRVALDQLAVEHGRGAHRQQADERADLELDRGAVGHPHHVVVEAVLHRPTVTVSASGGFIAIEIHSKWVANFSAMSA